MKDKYYRRVETLIPGIKPGQKWINNGDSRFSDAGSKCGADFASFIVECALTDSKIKEFFKIYEGKPFLDLGAGITNAGYSIAHSSGASSYVGIECHHPEELRDEISRSIGNFAKPIPYTVVSCPMLHFLHRLPNEVGNTFASGIENLILKDNLQMMNQINAQIRRVTVSEGIHVSYESVFRPFPNFFDLTPKGCKNKLLIFCKKHDEQR